MYKTVEKRSHGRMEEWKTIRMTERQANREMAEWSRVEWQKRGLLDSELGVDESRHCSSH